MLLTIHWKVVPIIDNRWTGLDHAQVVSAQAVVQAAGDRAYLFSAQMAGGGVTGQRAGSTGVELKRKRNVFDPVDGWSLRPMFRRQPITQIILLAKVINTHAQLQLTNAPGRTRKPIQLEFGMYPQSMPTEWTHARTLRPWQSVRLDL